MTQSVETKPQIQELRKLLKGIECGMLTTIDDHGSLHPTFRTSKSSIQKLHLRLIKSYSF